MSVDWEFHFLAFGPDDSIEKLYTSLRDMTWSEDQDATPQKLFYETMILMRSYGFVVATVGRNYYGADAIEDMAHQFSDLFFQGSGYVTPYMENYYLFESRHGQTTWQTVDRTADIHPDPEFTLEEKIRIERAISEIKERLQHDKNNLINCEDYLERNLNFTSDTEPHPTNPDAD